MTALRPELRTVPGAPCLTYEQTFHRVYEAIVRHHRLAHGRLDAPRGEHCAVGWYFAESNMALPSNAIDEIAAYNDSFPRLTPYERWRKVFAWLKARAKR